MAEHSDGDTPETPFETADAASAAAEAGPSEVNAALEQQVAELRDEVLRARAEMDNMRKRAQRDVEAAHKFGLERLVSELLPVKDSLELGLGAAEQAADVAAIREGMSLTYKLFGDALEKLGVKVVAAEGEKFNPELHQAMGMEVRADLPAGTVLKVMQTGYTLNDRLVRPAMVVVSRQS